VNQSYTGLKAYSRATHTVNKTRQVVMLYDGAVRFLQHASEAIEKKDYETRYNKLVRVSDILIGLQSCIDFDAGGSSAKILFDFYSTMDTRVFALHRSNDLAACQAIISELKEMRDAWDKIDRAQESADPQGAKPADGNSLDSSIVSA
jgi:flagellar secretion chaperone FliS